MMNRELQLSEEVLLPSHHEPPLKNIPMVVVGKAGEFISVNSWIPRMLLSNQAQKEVVLPRLHPLKSLSGGMVCDGGCDYGTV